MTTLPLPAAKHARVEQVVRDGAPIATLESPEELHYAARAWNWDDGVAELRAIVLRPDCALATASLVFWRGVPDEAIGAYVEREGAEEEGLAALWDLQRLICDRVAAGDYTGHDIGYDPRDDDGTDWVADYPAEPAHPVPRALTEAAPGRRADPKIRF